MEKYKQKIIWKIENRNGKRKNGFLSNHPILARIEMRFTRSITIWPGRPRDNERLLFSFVLYMYAEIGLPDKSALTDDLHRDPISCIVRIIILANIVKIKLVSFPKSSQQKKKEKREARSQQGAK
jgi:hypothetical protein